MSGLTVTLSWEHEDALRYGARTMFSTGPAVDGVRAFMNDLMIVGTNERVELPAAWLEAFLVAFKRATLITGLKGLAKDRLRRQTAKIQKAVDSSAVDRLGMVAG